MKYNDNELRSLIVERFDKPHHRCHEDQNWSNSQTWDIRSASCADHLQLTAVIVNNKIQKACFSGHACAISIASADLFIDRIIGKDFSEILPIMNDYQNLINNGISEIDPKVVDLDNLIAFKNVHRQKNRKNCALMIINGLEQLLKEYGK